MPSVKRLVVGRPQVEGLDLGLYNQQLTTTIGTQRCHFMRHTQEPKRLDIIDILPECRVDFIRVERTGTQLLA